MEILNIEEIGNTPLRKKALEILAEGIENTLPDRVLPKYVSYKKGKLKIKEDEFSIDNKLYVFGCGKAAGLMAQVIETIIPLEKITKGLVNSIKKLPTQKIIINESSHPIPDERGLYGVKEIFRLIKEIKPEDTILCLLSGGGSALLPDIPEGIRLDDLQKMTDLFIKSGAETYEMNIVRKHVSTLKGGKLAKILQPSKVISLIISDDLDGREDTASRPTDYEDSTFQEAYHIVEKYHLLEKIPFSIRDFLEKGLRQEIPENPKRGEPFLKNVYNYILADNKTALDAMKEKATSFGFKTYVLDKIIKGETRISAKKIGNFFNENYKDENESLAILYGSETIVTVKGNGQGGRIQEFVASLIEDLQHQKNSVIASVGSDGRDFISGVGGAIIDNETFSLSKRKKLDIDKFLENNDTYTLHKSLGSLILMNPTYTNVGDLHVYLREKNN